MRTGENLPIGNGPWTIAVTQEKASPVIDVALYLLDGSGRVRGDGDMVFYGQTRTMDGGVEFRTTEEGTVFTVAAMPASIERMALTAVGEDDADLGPVERITVEIRDAAGAVRAVIDMTTAGRSERAIVLADMYVRNGVVKVRSVCQGFDGGLARLSKHYGVEVTSDGESISSTAGRPDAGSVRPAPRVDPGPPGKKVSLAKNGVVSIRKTSGPITATLRWEGRGAGDGDLDFYCYAVDREGRQSKAYWRDRGSAERHPHVQHMGDSRRAGSETIVLHRPDNLRFALFAAYSAVNNGAGSFASYRPRMILTDQNGNEVTIPLLNDNQTSYWVAISHLSFDGETRIEHVETYGASGLRFIAAEKSPRLHPDGTWDVSKGIVEYKN